MTQILSNITYDQQNNLTTDIYLPQQIKPQHKILLFWHGGGWFRGDKSDLQELSLKIAEQGFIVFAPNYSLAPEYTFPVAHQDSVKFVKWLLNSKYSVTPTTKIAQIGASSGGVLALYLAGKFGFPTVTWSAPVSFSTWMKDHASTPASSAAQKELGLKKFTDINNAFYKYFTITYAGSDQLPTLQKLDAQSYNYQKLTHLLMINSTAELSPVSYLLEFISVLAKENHEVDLKLLPGTRHAMAYAKQYLAESVAYLTKAIEITN
ncbi:MULTISPECIES: alpha/beta hydrolase fold domain-containing protein [unclassified Lactobacillus]|uniref:alpha/beta hydrolase fold domain-containing protein n=1 Tax=unclassified Lactobacillus TaxID=2620435 RepID=UPI000EFCDDEB|nr:MULTISPECIES: alpha/beta hydrolase fold domain-containing protein [unclassified Lactobacillus]RMC25813.1 alpha/beta hydrolase [Lactobacillus sp. ESL0247]RMC29625.1 alpha/beta hydrolase [Lactobacillus sp. ESL0246]RMC33614.1 alpha/beta hydrolase [Lactobacillus sp. ESL0245]